MLNKRLRNDTTEMLQTSVGGWFVHKQMLVDFLNPNMQTVHDERVFSASNYKSPPRCLRFASMASYSCTYSSPPRLCSTRENGCLPPKPANGEICWTTMFTATCRKPSAYECWTVSSGTRALPLL